MPVACVVSSSPTTLTVLVVWVCPAVSGLSTVTAKSTVNAHLATATTNPRSTCTRPPPCGTQAAAVAASLNVTFAPSVSVRITFVSAWFPVFWYVIV